MRIVYSLIVLVCFFAAGCRTSADTESSGKLNGVHKYYYPDGSLYLEGTFRDSIPHGSFKQFFKNGQLYEEAIYENGIQHGITKRYYENGKLSMEIPYDSGKVHGVQKKFRKDGTKAYEAPYHYGIPCIGLQEYYTTGDPVKNLPRIIVTPEDKIWPDNRYSLRISISTDMKVEFYQGQLTDGKYIGNQATKIYTERDGTARIDYLVGRGMMVMERINIIAKVKTDLDNFYILQLPYTVAVQNR